MPKSINFTRFAVYMNYCLILSITFMKRIDEKAETIVLFQTSVISAVFSYFPSH